MLPSKRWAGSGRMACAVQPRIQRFRERSASSIPLIGPSARGSASRAPNQGRSTQGVAAAKSRAAARAADARQVRALEVADRRAGEPAQVRVLLDRGRELLAVDLRAEAQVGVAEVVR